MPGDENSITQTQMEKLFDKYFGSSAGTGKGPKIDPNDIASLSKYIKSTTEELKKSTPGLKSFGDFLTKTPFVDVSHQMDDLNDAIKKQTELAHKGGNATASRTIAELQAQKAELASAAAKKMAATAAMGFGTSVGQIATSMADGAFEFVKGLQDGASGVELATSAAKRLASSSFEAAAAGGQFAQSMGAIMSLMGGPWVKAIGLAISAIGWLVDFFGKKGAKYAAEAAQSLGDELKKTQKAFTDINSAGALFAGGMTEIRQEAYRAGLDVAQFATVIKASKDDLIEMGLGMGEASKRVAGVSKELRNSELGMQLRKLGYSAEEQAEMSAAVMANMNMAGDARINNDRAVAEETAKYGKDLKVLSDLTGQDAKKAMEKARLQAQEADVMAKAMKMGGPAAVEKLQKQLAAMPESMKKGYMEFVASGGKIVTDQATNIAMQQNPKLREMYAQQYQTLGSANKSASEAQDETLKLREQAGKYALEHNEQQSNFNTAMRLSHNTQYQGVVDINNQMVQDGIQLHAGITDKTREAAKKAAENMAPLDKATAELEENTQHLKAALGKELTDSVTKFAEVSAKGVDTVAGALKKLGVDVGSTTGTGSSSGSASSQSSSNWSNSPRTRAALANTKAPEPGSGEGSNPTAGGKGVPELGTITSKSGKTAQVGKGFVSQFQGIVNWLERQGYKIDSLGGYANRDVRNQPGKKSVHAFGGALDINPGANPLGTTLKTDMPDGVQQAAAALGLGWGGAWKSKKDAMHFSVEKSEGGNAKLYDKGGVLGANETAIAGEKGPEIVHGGSVTSTASTSKIFDQMNHHLAELVKLIKTQNHTSEKMYKAIA